MNKNIKTHISEPPRVLGTAAVILIAAYIGVQMISDIASLQVVSVFALPIFFCAKSRSVNEKG